MNNYIFLNERVYGPVTMEQPINYELFLMSPNYLSQGTWNEGCRLYRDHLESLPSYPAPDLKCKQGQVVVEGKDFTFQEGTFEGKSIIVAVGIPATETGSEGLKKVNDLHKLVQYMIEEFPCNQPLYLDSGLWQMRSDDMEDVFIKGLPLKRSVSIEQQSQQGRLREALVKIAKGPMDEDKNEWSDYVHNIATEALS